MLPAWWRLVSKALRRKSEPKNLTHRLLLEETSSYYRRRTFFASSTDHSTLLQNAEIHKLKNYDGNSKESTPTTTYVLTAEGMESDIVQKVPQLHLARLSLLLDDASNSGSSVVVPTLFGAKVVNSTLGVPRDVCGKLVDAALQDAFAHSKTSSNGNGMVVHAKSNLWGLTEWVQDGLLIDPLTSPSSSSTSSLDDDDSTKDDVKEIVRLGVEAIIAQKQSTIPDEVLPVFETAWEVLARDFLQQGLGEEAALYQSKGGILSEIIHQADDSEYAISSGRSMALFTMTP